MTVRRINIQLLLASLCLLMGISIYLLFRSRQHLGFIVLDSLGFASAIDAIRSLTRDVAVPEFVRFCLPDGLWTTSYILFSDWFNRNEAQKSRLLWTSAIPVIGCVSEIMQLFGLLPGVFDILDLACYSLPFLAYLIYIIKKKHG